MHAACLLSIVEMGLVAEFASNNIGIKLDERGLALLRALLSLEERLCGAAEAGRAPEPWGVMARLTPALFHWGSGQLTLLQSWTQRLLAGKDWKPVTQPHGCARYAHWI